MKICLSVVTSIVAISMLMGCASKPRYRSEITIGPAPAGSAKTHHRVDIKILKLIDGKEQIVTAPVAIVAEGKEGAIVSSDDSLGNSFKSDIFIERNNGKLEGTVTTTLKQENKTVWRDKQIVAVNQ